MKSTWDIQRKMLSSRRMNVAWKKNNSPTNDVRRKNIAAVIAQSKFFLDHDNVGLP